ncbi:hypothetical protein [Rhizobium oryzicola]|uniref:Uncharacterized protein n=1 Tax=Rhizobium oryzicola TaxID=1232668 RepID=A0ABT8T4H0_9HYPH|nr:hypothetical protein [Rhizobium oryzicola]MDO1585632.1 hypothetical protein [Rhizobium oryzicola]
MERVDKSRPALGRNHLLIGYGQDVVIPTEGRDDLPRCGFWKHGDDVGKQSDFFIDVIETGAKENSLPAFSRPPHHFQLSKAVGLSLTDSSHERGKVSPSSESLAEQDATGLNVTVDRVRFLNREDRKT